MENRRFAAFFDSAGQNGGAPIWLKFTTQLSALHRPTVILSPSGEKNFTYDLLGRKTAVTKGAGSKLAATNTHTFDAVGNEIQSTTTTGQITRHEYDAHNRRISTFDALNRALIFTYDTDSGPSGTAPCCGADSPPPPSILTAPKKPAPPTPQASSSPPQTPKVTASTTPMTPMAAAPPPPTPKAASPPGATTLSASSRPKPTPTKPPSLTSTTSPVR